MREKGKGDSLERAKLKGPTRPARRWASFGFFLTIYLHTLEYQPRRTADRLPRKCLSHETSK